MRGSRAVLLTWAVVVALVACSRAPEPSTPAPTPGTRPPVAEGRAAPVSREAVEPIPVEAGFRHALEADTRTLQGMPGRAYWQQQVDYRIEAELDPTTARLRGEEVITYHNRSPDRLPVLIFHLYQNLFREGVQRTRQVPITGGMTIERVSVDGEQAAPVGAGAAPVRTGAAYQIDQTIMALRLPRPVAPGDSVQVEIAWHYTVPPAGAPRTGHIDHELYNVAQWYPQVAVYDDIRGWDTTPYLGNGEFYLEYGEFDVSITVPEGWLVAATGVLQNPEEVLTGETRRRLAQALETDEIVHVVTEQDFGPGGATAQTPGGQLTWVFEAKDVRDFAFATANRYLWDATRAVVPTVQGQTKTIPVYAFYRPIAETWRRAAEYTRHATEFHAQRWYPYVYPQITSVEGPIGGMEYPMIVFVQDFGDAETLYQVINHEVGHEWYPMMAGSNEHAFAWQDEGVNTYIENLATADFFDRPLTNAFERDRDRYLQLAGQDVEKPIMREADLFGLYGSFATASYSKPAVLLQALADIIGEETLHAALRQYSERWHLKHPHALDFFNTVENVAGQDLDWFWHPWWYETAVLDQSIVAVEPAAAGEVAITIEDQGEAPMPVDLVITTAGGETQRVLVPVDVWLAGARRHTETVPLTGAVTRVAIDPDLSFPDVDRSDNVWERGAANRNGNE